MTVKWEGDKIVALVRKATMRGVVRGTERVREEIISLILNGSKTGRVYRRRGVQHQASAPGEAPASDTGQLVNGIETKFIRRELTGLVNSTAAHGAHTEFGTRNMEERPHMRPGLDNVADDVLDDITNEIRKVLK